MIRLNTATSEKPQRDHDAPRSSEYVCVYSLEQLWSRIGCLRRQLLGTQFARASAQWQRQRLFYAPAAPASVLFGKVAHILFRLGAPSSGQVEHIIIMCSR